MSRTDNTVHIGDGLPDDIVKIRNEINAQREYISNIRKQMNYLQSVWDSPVQRKFSQRFEIDSVSMIEYCDLLTQYLNQIESLGNSYIEANDILRAGIAKIQM